MMVEEEEEEEEEEKKKKKERRKRGRWGTDEVSSDFDSVFESTKVIDQTNLRKRGKMYI